MNYSMNWKTPYWKRYANRFPYEFRWFADRWIKEGWLPKDFYAQFDRYKP